MEKSQIRYAISIGEAAQRLDISRAQGYSAVKQGLIPTIRLGKRCRRVPLERLERLLNGAEEREQDR